MKWRALVVGVLALTAACSNGDGTSADADGARKLQSRVRTDPPGVVVARDTQCEFDGDRKITASGVVENAGDTSHNVSIAVRFIDSDDVRVDLASDSVSDLERGESARWDASIYTDDPDQVVTCEVSTRSS